MKAASLVVMLALSWNPEYAWFDPATRTTTSAGKPGGGGLISTGGSRAGGTRCDHCHVRPVAGPNGHIDAGVAFLPALTGGRYAAGQRYTVTVNMSGEHRRSPMNVSEDGFAGNFELVDGGVAGSLISDTAGFAASNCQATLGSLTAATPGTTVTYSDCGFIVHRARQNNTQWTFDWVAPAANEGDVTFWFGVVDANGNDRTAQADAGLEDDVYMGKLVLTGP